MNTKLRTGLLIFFFFVSASAFAQYNGYGRGSSPGMDRSVGRVPKVAGKGKEKKEIDVVEVTVQYLDKRLTLDDFQAAVITNIYNENKAELLAISMDNAPTDVRKDQIRQITEAIDVKIMEYLSEEQINEYKKMIAERKY